MNATGAVGTRVADRSALDGQRGHWERVLGESPDRFGADESAPARAAEGAFRAMGASRVLELGAGQGRDSLYFASHGYEVVALDYAASAAAEIERKARMTGLADSLRAITHDLRQPLPFANASFDACYSHMLYCMAFTLDELRALSIEIGRILKPGGLNVFTTRNTRDPDFGQGVHRGEGLYEVGGFIVHFLDEACIEQLAAGFDIVEIAELEEGSLPRRLCRVTMRTQTAS
jgi:SAM-dependent methyltransferase